MANIETSEIKKLFDLTMKKKWNEVAKVYEDEALWAPGAQLTKRGDTALHVALLLSFKANDMSTYYTDVKKMIDCMPEGSLEVKNIKGNTPLHLAAAVGWKEICEHIASKNWELITRRNEKHETPLFMAARHGEKEAFRCLQEIYDKNYKRRVHELRNPPSNINGDNDDVRILRMSQLSAYVETGESLCRRRDGNTALHSAISGECLQLALEIIKCYPKLVDKVNMEGESALHVLAKKTHIFGDMGLGFWDNLLYNYALEEPSQWATDELGPEAKSSKKFNFPENYETCFDIFSFLWRFIKYSFISEGPPKTTNGSRTDEENPPEMESKRTLGFFPANYRTLILLLRFAASIILTVIGVGLGKISKMRRHKKRYSEAIEIVDRLVAKESIPYGNDGQMPSQTTVLARLDSNRIEPPMREPDEQARVMMTRNDTAFLLAARTGVSYIVEKIIHKLPIAIYDLDSKGRNVLMVAAEHRQTTVFNSLRKRSLPAHIDHHVDNDGNNIIHVAAMLEPHSKPCRIPGAALQMQWEIKWLEYVKKEVPQICLAHDRNDHGSTPEMIFTDKHTDLMKEGYSWLIKTSESCSVVAALVAGVAFATSASVPGGLNQESGRPILEGEVAFDVFSISSLISLCLSVTALVFFLSIITSRCLEKDFKSDLPSKLLYGLSCLFSSIVGMLVSFCAGHTFILKDTLKFVEVPIYALACIPITLFVLAQMPLYADLLRATWKNEPLQNH